MPPESLNMPNLIVYKNTILSEEQCAQMRAAMTQPECFLTLPPAANSTFATLRHIQVTQLMGTIKPSASLAACDNPLQGRLVAMLLNVSGEFKKHPRDGHSCVYLFQDGYMFVHWANIIMEKNFFNDDNETTDLGENIHIESFENSNHERMRFLNAVRHVLDTSPQIKTKPQISFA